MSHAKLLLLQKNLTVCKKMSSGSFKNLFNKMCLQIIYIKYIFINIR